MAKKHSLKAQVRKEEKEFAEEVLQIDRVTRVVKGGRRLRFRATVVIGDRKGRVGIGIGKATEVAAAIQKGISKAKKELITIPMVNDTVPHDVKLKFKSSLIMIRPAAQGTGLVVGGAMRKILDLAGIKNIVGKSYNSNNRVVNAQATIKALQNLNPVDSELFPKKKPVKKQEQVAGKEDVKEKEEEKKKAEKPTKKPTKK